MGRIPISWPLVAAALALLFHIFSYYPLIVDDAFISLRYAQRLLQGNGLTWNDGEYVEGYSNLLWVLLTALLGALGISLEVAARGLGIGSALATLFVLAWHGRQAQLAVPKTMPLLEGWWILVITPPVAIWAIAGLESGMVMLCLTLAVVSCYRLLDNAPVKSMIVAGSALALIVLLRPEGPLFTVAVALGIMVSAPQGFAQRLKLALSVSVIPFVVFLAFLAFRLSVYGQWVPNTVLVKVAFTDTRLMHGFMYVGGALFSFLPMLIYIGLNRSCVRREWPNLSSRYMRFLWIVFIVMSSFIWIGGGDIFYGYRAFVPLVPLMALMVMHTMSVLVRHVPIKKEAMFYLLVLVLYGGGQFAVDDNKVNRSGQTHWVDTARDIGLALKARYGDKQPMVATHAAGAIPYYSELPALDMFGLNDPNLGKRRHEQKQFGKGLAGHELLDGNYIESRKPDILVMDIPGLPPLCEDHFKAQCDIFLPHYRKEILAVPGHEVTIWVRKDSDKVMKH